MALNGLLARDGRAREFYEALHPSVRREVDRRAEEIVLDEDLYAIANNQMSESLEEFRQIFDDGTL